MKIKTEEVRGELNKCYRKLRNLRNKTKVGTKRHRYISVLTNWLWFLEQIDLRDSKNLPFLDYADILKVKEKIKIEREGEKK